MTYILQWSESGPNGKPSIDLSPLQVDRDSTSLILTGKGTPYYGEYHQQNFIRLLENFASSNRQLAPQKPTVGQLWFNTTESALYVFDKVINDWKRVGGITVGPGPITNMFEGDLWWKTGDKTLSVYDGSAWQQVWPSMSIVPVAYVEEYNKLVDRYNTLAATPNQYQAGAATTYTNWSGYGQLPLSYATVLDMTNAKWMDLINKYIALANHQGTSTSGIPSRGFILDKSTQHGVVTALSEYTSFLGAVSQIEANRWNVNPLSLELVALANASTTRTQPYFYEKDHEVVISFNDINHARAYFNAGGNFRISASFTPSQSTSFNTSWQTFISSLGTITFDAKGTHYSGAAAGTPGFYNLALGGAYVTIFSSVSQIAGSRGAKYSIQARLEQTAAPAVSIRFKIAFAPEGVNTIYNSAYNSSNSSASGSTVSSVASSKASELYLGNNEIALPTATQTGTFMTDPAA